MSLSDLSRARKEYKCYDCNKPISKGDKYIRLSRGDNYVQVRGAWNQNNPYFKEQHPVCKECYLRENPIVEATSFEKGKYYSYLWDDDKFNSDEDKNCIIATRTVFVEDIYAINKTTEKEKKIKCDKDYIGSKKFDLEYELDATTICLNTYRGNFFEVTDKDIIRQSKEIKEEQEKELDYWSDLAEAQAV
ncbi:hypothetical protein CP985_13490 [Malaciobacter mytili LMG 24559]|uniref:Uncharacterized protein n=1 Tax=Malaciobacter mytili LMG 24559 TaxID=1032238 RepID=A0AAX2AF07_9BACT|nr:hypothetical protein [Malaciobacter mytili]AXH16498.1 hypothetical protein AMYT_a0200 [Malaciobacter mytili LMG 24559]RXK13002.1 hypothetical protein CP985_13490 [Malaciobacter mytili LMG 24559]